MFSFTWNFVYRCKHFNVLCYHFIPFFLTSIFMNFNDLGHFIIHWNSVFKSHVMIKLQGWRKHYWHFCCSFTFQIHIIFWMGTIFFNSIKLKLTRNMVIPCPVLQMSGIIFHVFIKRINRFWKLADFIEMYPLISMNDFWRNLVEKLPNHYWKNLF